MSERRVVITGLGCVTAIAETAEDLFNKLCAGQSGVTRIENFDTSAFPVLIGGEIKNFEPKKYLDHRESRRMDRFTQLAAASAVIAVKDSGIDFASTDPTRAGVVVGTGIGGIQEIEQQHKRLLNKGPGKVSPFCVPKLMGNAACGTISILYGLRGPNFCIVTACASASNAIGEAMHLVKDGRCDTIITGGSEAALSPLGLSSFCALRSLSTRNDAPTLASRPFDRDRDGFVMAEAGGIVILEEYEHAKKRGAKIYAELLGYGTTGDGYHITAPLPDGKGASEAIALALRQSGIDKDKIDYVNAHGTSTELNDIAESLAIKRVFGDHAYNLAISSTKSCLGHSLGASGAIELIVVVKSIEKSVVHPTINLDNVDERCDSKLNFVPKEAQQKKVNYAISNSFGFGGHNACLVVGKV